ncbi:hypothetical protein HDU97_006429 [Phlyctochytrium planicorne]|nr:hypothetical protein HDU97_006429 [Phlyctochytrium planicorne]
MSSSPPGPSSASVASSSSSMHGSTSSGNGGHVSPAGRRKTKQSTGVVSFDPQSPGVFDQNSANAAAMAAKAAVKANGPGAYPLTQGHMIPPGSGPAPFNPYDPYYSSYHQQHQPYYQPHPNPNMQRSFSVPVMPSYGSQPYPMPPNQGRQQQQPHQPHYSPTQTPATPQQSLNRVAPPPPSSPASPYNPMYAAAAGNNAYYAAAAAAAQQQYWPGYGSTPWGMPMVQQPQPPAARPVQLFFAEYGGERFPGFYDEYGQYHYFRNTEEAAAATQRAKKVTEGASSNSGRKRSNSKSSQASSTVHDSPSLNGSPLAFKPATSAALLSAKRSESPATSLSSFLLDKEQGKVVETKTLLEDSSRSGRVSPVDDVTAVEEVTKVPEAAPEKAKQVPVPAVASIEPVTAAAVEPVSAPVVAPAAEIEQQVTPAPVKSTTSLPPIAITTTIEAASTPAEPHRPNQADDRSLLTSPVTSDQGPTTPTTPTTPTSFLLSRLSGRRKSNQSEISDKTTPPPVPPIPAGYGLAAPPPPITNDDAESTHSTKSNLLKTFMTEKAQPFMKKAKTTLGGIAEGITEGMGRSSSSPAIVTSGNAGGEGAPASASTTNSPASPSVEGGAKGLNFQKYLKAPLAMLGPKAGEKANGNVGTSSSSSSTHSANEASVSTFSPTPSPKMSPGVVTASADKSPKKESPLQRGATYLLGKMPFEAKLPFEDKFGFKKKKKEGETVSIASEPSQTGVDMPSGEIEYPAVLLSNHAPPPPIAFSRPEKAALGMDEPQPAPKLNSDYALAVSRYNQEGREWQSTGAGSSSFQPVRPMMPMGIDSIGVPGAAPMPPPNARRVVPAGPAPPPPTMTLKELVDVSLNSTYVPPPLMPAPAPATKDMPLSTLVDVSLNSKFTPPAPNPAQVDPNPLPPPPPVAKPVIVTPPMTLIDHVGVPQQQQQQQQRVEVAPPIVNHVLGALTESGGDSRRSSNADVVRPMTGAEIAQMAQQQQQQQANGMEEMRRAAMVDTIISKGYDMEDALFALESYRYNVDLALELLESNRQAVNMLHSTGTANTGPGEPETEESHLPSPPVTASATVTPVSPPLPSPPPVAPVAIAPISAVPFALQNPLLNLDMDKTLPRIRNSVLVDTTAQVSETSSEATASSPKNLLSMEQFREYRRRSLVLETVEDQKESKRRSTVIPMRMTSLDLASGVELGRPAPASPENEPEEPYVAPAYVSAGGAFKGSFLGQPVSPHEPLSGKDSLHMTLDSFSPPPTPDRKSFSEMVLDDLGMTDASKPFPGLPSGPTHIRGPLPAPPPPARSPDSKLMPPPPPPARIASPALPRVPPSVFEGIDKDLPPAPPERWVVPVPE